MKRYNEVSLAVALLAGTLAPGTAVAQQRDNVGLVWQIAEIVRGSPVEIRQTTDKVRLRGAGASWINVGPRTPITPTAGVRVQRYVDAKVRVDLRTHKGELILLPELLNRTGQHVFPRQGPAATARDSVVGEYTVGSDPASAEDLLVTLQRGSLVVNWDFGGLRVQLAGHRPRVIGTRLALATDDDGETGYLFLDHGSIDFPDYPDSRVSEGELVRLRPGVPPEIVPLTAIAVEALRSAVQYHHIEIWNFPTPFWRRREVLGPAAIAIIGGAIWAFTRNRSRTGTVEVEIP